MNKHEHRQLPLIYHPPSGSTHRAPSGCNACNLLPQCGGIDEQQTLWGCFSACVEECGSGSKKCDWVCPAKSDFVDRIREVDGLSRRVQRLLPMETEPLPIYVPMIRHRSRRISCVSADIVAISLFDVLRMNPDRRYAPIVTNGSDLRAHFGIRDDAKVLLVGVAIDKHIERYWRFRSRDHVARAISQLSACGVTIPNFSFFLGAPRPHTLWNRARMMKVTDELSAAGVPVIPHLNAIVREDWAYWTDFLREHQEVRFVAKEFQTGLRLRTKGEKAIISIAQMQDDLGREIHPIAIGGAQYAPILASKFRRFTIVDSSPFIKTVKRQQQLERQNAWESTETSRGHPIDDLLESNLNRYRARILRACKGSGVSRQRKSGEQNVA